MKIVNYSYERVSSREEYNPKTDTLTEYYNMVTTITFGNGDKVSVSCPEEKADQYTGFYTAVAKYAMGGNNTVNNEAEYWIKQKPIKDMREYLKKQNEIAAEKERKQEEARKAKKNAIKREARKRKFAYEAAVLANEKYGVPINFEVINNV